MKPLKAGEFARIFGGVIVMLVILLGTFAAVQALAVSPLWTGGADAAGWLSAIGTIGTLIYAIVLANSQERQRRHEAHTVAQVFAAGLDADMTHALDLLCENDEHLGRVLMGGVFEGSKVMNRFMVIRQIDTADLAILVPLRDGLAVKLTYAQGRLNTARRKFEQLFPVADFKPTTLELPKIEEMRQWNDFLLRLYVEVKMLCQHAGDDLRVQVESDKSRTHS